MRVTFRAPPVVAKQLRKKAAEQNLATAALIRLILWRELSVFNPDLPKPASVKPRKRETTHTSTVFAAGIPEPLWDTLAAAAKDAFMTPSDFALTAAEYWLEEESSEKNNN